MDESFVEAAVESWGSTVLRVAASVTGSRADAEDVFSDVFFALYKQRGGFFSQEHLKAWLIRAAINRAKNIRLSAHARRRSELDENIAAPETADACGEVLSALQRLKPAERSVVYLHYYEGYRFTEIARITGMREGSVRSAAARARKNLKGLLEENDAF